jgi:hypothetical protein
MFSSLHLQLVHARQRELLDAALRHREAARDDHPRAARPHRAKVLWRVAEAVRARQAATGPPAGAAHKTTCALSPTQPRDRDFPYPPKAVTSTKRASQSGW